MRLATLKPEISFGLSAHYTEFATNPQEEVEMRKTTLHFGPQNGTFFNSDQFKAYENFSLSYIRGAWGVLGIILDLPGGI